MLLVPLLGPLLLLAVWLAWWSPKSRRPLELDPSIQGALVAGHRKVVSWRWAGLGLGLIVSAVTAATAHVRLHNVGAMPSAIGHRPSAFGLCVIGGVVVGELTTIPRSQGLRTAALETRTVRDYLPRRLSAMVATSALGLGVLLVTRP